MPEVPSALVGPILAVDIGATFTKYCPVDERGELLEEVTRVATAYPCTPEKLVDAVATVITVSGLNRCGVGFPGDMTDGRVIEPGNLARSGGIATAVDPRIEQAWWSFDLQSALQSRCAAAVRVVNDATLAAYGYCEGVGRELVITLGTGFGISLVVQGEWRKIRDVGAAMYRALGTYDEVFGEPARERDAARWRSRLPDALTAFVEEFAADVVHVGGGNARFLRSDDLAGIGCRVEFHGNEGTLRGAARLFAGG